MARKIRVDSSNTVGVWVQKTNTMSDYMGDLEQLSGVFDSDLGYDIPNQDSNLIAAINHISWVAPTINKEFFGETADSLVAGARNLAPGTGPNGSTIKITAHLVVDSANFDKINLQLLRNNDSSMLAFQPDSDFFADSNQLVGGLHFDFNADSATINRLTVVDSHNIDTLDGDSIQIGNILVGDPNGTIGKLSMDDSSRIIFGSANIITSGDTEVFDSVLVTNTIRILDSFIITTGSDSGLIVDSAYIDRLVYPVWDSIGMGDSFGLPAVSAGIFTINKMLIHNELQADSISINRLIFDNLIFDSVEQFILGDSTGTAIFAAYTLEESN